MQCSQHISYQPPPTAGTYHLPPCSPHGSCNRAQQQYNVYMFVHISACAWSQCYPLNIHCQETNKPSSCMHEKLHTQLIYISCATVESIHVCIYINSAHCSWWWKYCPKHTCIHVHVTLDQKLTHDAGVFINHAMSILHIQETVYTHMLDTSSTKRCLPGRQRAVFTLVIARQNTQQLKTRLC